MLMMVKTYTYAGGRQAWGVETQLERCAVSRDSRCYCSVGTELLMTEK